MQAQESVGATINFLAEIENVEFTPQLQGLAGRIGLAAGASGLKQIAGRGSSIPIHYL